MIPVATVDFETYASGPRPEAYPPVPVGVAIQAPGERTPRYLAWGHPLENNATEADGCRALQEVWDRWPILCHGAQFDLEVAHEHMGLPLVPRHGFHDTLLLAFLHDPNAERLSLKDLAADLLGMPPDEQTALRNWIHEHIKGARRLKKKWGMHIAKAPGKLVGRYTKGDVRRTLRLLRFFEKESLVGSPAYERERELLPMLVGMARRGVPISLERLDAEIATSQASLERVEAWLLRKLGRDVNLDSGEEVADAMERVDLLSEWVLTDTDARSVSAENLRLTDCDPTFIGAWELRNLIGWTLRTHLQAWHETAHPSGGRVFCSWNQVRQANERQYGRAYGARTGRLSSNPNLQNIAKRTPVLVPSEREKKRVEASRQEALLVPRALVGVYVPDPRSVVCAPRGQRFAGADFSGQELRILAFFAGGNLRAKYLEDARFDLHGDTRVSLETEYGISLSRTHTKNMIFGRIYRSGIDKTARMLGTTPENAQAVRKGIDRVIPEMNALYHRLVSAGACMTWGGRVNPAEPATFVKGEWREFAYKLLNTLVQGSAADVTKEAMIRYEADPDREGECVLQAHDELLVVGPTKVSRRELSRLRMHMESIEMGGIPMPTDGATGKTWRECR